LSEPLPFLSIAQYIAWEEDVFNVANDVEIKVVKMFMPIRWVRKMKTMMLIWFNVIQAIG
jgi:hypothetical protein